MCGSRKKFIRGGGGGGVLTAKFVEKMYENKLEFPGGRVDANQKNLPCGDCGYFLEVHNKTKEITSRFRDIYLISLYLIQIIPLSLGTRLNFNISKLVYFQPCWGEQAHAKTPESTSLVYFVTLARCSRYS